MMRIGFLPSDFNPMLLMLGEAEDCRALAGVLRQFARDGGDVSLNDLRFCRSNGTRVRLTSGPGPLGVEWARDEVLWRMTPALAGVYAEQLDDLADPKRIAGSESLDPGTEDGISVKVSRGEYTDDFLVGR